MKHLCHFHGPLVLFRLSQRMPTVCFKKEKENTKT